MIPAIDPATAGFETDPVRALAVLVRERENIARSGGLEWGYFGRLRVANMPSWRDGLVVAEVTGEIPGLVWKVRHDPESHALAVRDGIPYVLSPGHWHRHRLLPMAMVRRCYKAAMGLP